MYAAANDVDDFADKLDALLDDPEARERMSKLGRKRAEATLAWEHQERSLLAAYERALALRGNVPGNQAHSRRRSAGRGRLDALKVAVPASRE